MNTSLDDAILFALLLNGEAVPSRHPLHTDDCPSLPELERLVAGGARWHSAQLQHQSACPYCQLACMLFRQEMHINPWWDELRDLAQRAFDKLDQLGKSIAAANAEIVFAAGADISQNEIRRTVAAVYAPIHEPLCEVSVAVQTARFTPDCCLRLLVKLKEPQVVRLPEPVELTIVAAPNQQPLDAFLLPEFAAGQAADLKLWLPAEYRNAWQQLDAMPELPFQFILRTPSESVAEEMASQPNGGD